MKFIQEAENQSAKQHKTLIAQKKIRIPIGYVESNGSNLFRYAGKNKRGEPLEAGKYIILKSGYRRFTLEEKKKLQLIAAVNEQGRFMWLAPNQIYIVNYLTGSIPAELAYYNVEKEFDGSIWSEALKYGFNFDILHTWQKDFLLDCQCFLKNGISYKRNAIARVGGGKTLLGLLLLSLTSPEKGLILAPKYLHSTWAEECEKWFPGRKLPSISTYASAKKYLDTGIEVLIVDEALAIANPLAQRTVAIRKLAKKAAIVVGYTGTSISSTPTQIMWNNLSHDGVVPDTKHAFGFFYAEADLEEVKPGVEVYKYTNYDYDRIANDLVPYCKIIDEKELAKDLPEITHQRIYVDRPNHYETVLCGGATTSTQQKVIAQVKQITDGFIYNDLGQAIRMSSEKVDSAYDLVKNINEPIVIVAAYKETVVMLAEKFKEFNPSILNADTNDEAYEINRFKAGETSVFIISAEKVYGMNLQEICSIMIFLSHSTKPSLFTQAIGRIHRNGQERNVMIYHLLCKDTMDEKRLDLIQSHINDGESIINAGLKEQILIELNKYKK